MCYQHPTCLCCSTLLHISNPAGSVLQVLPESIGHAIAVEQGAGQLNKEAFTRCGNPGLWLTPASAVAWFVDKLLSVRSRQGAGALILQKIQCLDDLILEKTFVRVSGASLKATQGLHGATSCTDRATASNALTLPLSYCMYAFAINLLEVKFSM